ncbi:hypothetical protein PINS_up004073 [Pythium insidiosum]|nr:hypothetical protein PINS_up004073 [Pythium insidiosum]
MNEWSMLSRLPPVAQLAAARITGDPFAGYNVSAAQRAQLEQLRCAEDSIAVVIGCGRTTVSLCAAMRMTWSQPTASQCAADNVFNVQIQHPRTPLSLFDAVITPQHDVSEGATVPDNLLLTTGTVSLLDHNEVTEEGLKWEAALKPYLQGKDRRAVWLVGGPCRGFSFDTHVVEEMIASVLNLVRGQDGTKTSSLLVTFSRRTPETVKRMIEERLTSALDASHELFIWNGEGLNPYLALLHHASVLVTTPDSVSMTTEAILSGKQVCTVGAEHMKGKFRRFHDTLQARGDVIPLPISGGITHSNGCIGRDEIEQELDAIAGDLVHKIVERIKCSTV